MARAVVSREERPAGRAGAPPTTGDDGRVRAVVEGVSPEIDGGRYPIKRVTGEAVVVEADCFGDGHEAIACALLYRHETDAGWTRVDMDPLGNDRWRAAFEVSLPGRYRYTVEAWVDHFQSWRSDLVKRSGAGQDLAVPLMLGAQLAEEAAERAEGKPAEELRRWGRRLAEGETPQEVRHQAALDPHLAALMRAHPDLRLACRYDRELAVEVDRPKARFSTWYEMFPRSCATAPGRHGTFKDCEARLPYIASMGFDVLYLPPVHPIGTTHRKGKNNATEAGPEEPGSPWGIGSPEGGHKAVHPELGTLGDFRDLVKQAGRHGIEVALDIAFQCSPDHPYVREHPEWFRHRPDGSIQYAENPPKQYQDIYPLDFENEHWRELWEELKSVVLFWTEQGVRIFRVDNPHTKPFRFWEWLIREVRREHAEVIFLAEAFTRPKVMYRLAKLGFTQSYTYFAWRNTKQELTEYFTELNAPPVADFFRPNLWPNTPDILTEALQHGGRPAFMARLLLAATLGASYGIYGPAFELGEHLPREPGGEEYLNSEKYEIKHWDLDRPDSLRPLIAQVNRIRRENPALQRDRGLVFHGIDNDQLLCYSKVSADGLNTVLVVVNLDPRWTQSGWTSLSLPAMGIAPGEAFRVRDLLTGDSYAWVGDRNYVQLNPQELPAHIFLVERSGASG